MKTGYKRDIVPRWIGTYTNRECNLSLVYKVVEGGLELKYII